MTPASRIAEIRKRLEAATPGKWRAAVLPVSDNLFYVGFGTYDGGPVAENDAEFIAEAPTDIAFLLDEIEKLQSAIFIYEMATGTKMKELIRDDEAK